MMFRITRPTLLLDEKICRSNIRKMAEKAGKHQVQLIPHFKTHQSARVGEWFREAGVKAITVTSVKMAEYFAGNGWKDVMIAFPVNVLEIEELNRLASKVELKILLNNVEAANILKEKLRTSVKFYIEVDTGDGRSGIKAENYSEISNILETVRNSKLLFNGFYTHPGHTYNAASPEEVKEISATVLERLKVLKGHFRKEFPKLKIGLGDTPSCSIADKFEGVDSIHPGNFVYYDLVQQSLGANSFAEIAICLAVPIVELNPGRNQAIVHSGWVHQGKDSLPTPGGDVQYGLVVELTQNGWSEPVPGAMVVKLSQEHGVLSLPEIMFNKLKTGDVIGILPVHACATAVMMGEIWTLKGERLEMMPR